MIDDNLTAVYNPYSWNNVSNMLYISQPVGTGFSYQKQGVGSFNPFSEDFHYNSTEWPATGRWPLLEPLNKGTIDTTDLAAVATWVRLNEPIPTVICKLTTSCVARFPGTACYHSQVRRKTWCFEPSTRLQPLYRVLWRSLRSFLLHLLLQPKPEDPERKHARLPNELQLSRYNQRYH